MRFLVLNSSLLPVESDPTSSIGRGFEELSTSLRLGSLYRPLRLPCLARPSYRHGDLPSSLGLSLPLSSYPCASWRIRQIKNFRPRLGGGVDLEYFNTGDLSVSRYLARAGFIYGELFVREYRFLCEL